ncbi:hypothetical protein D3P96_06275 [Weissella viridescens]|uniref:Uncharacterized protein n=1 Tax=Weissella viridescens TaxID=1629 RepID=A0A3P2RAA0_WEIVI|nr:hypothetical protein [Weissella viridescens]RRG17759.1 hypothetical protein D3P96_06275 [Weissella viridescens]
MDNMKPGDKTGEFIGHAKNGMEVEWDKDRKGRWRNVYITDVKNKFNDVKEEPSSIVESGYYDNYRVKTTPEGIKWVLDGLETDMNQILDYCKDKKSWNSDYDGITFYGDDWEAGYDCYEFPKKIEKNQAVVENFHDYPDETIDIAYVTLEQLYDYFVDEVNHANTFVYRPQDIAKMKEKLPEVKKAFGL